jgi:hypothetical protein
MQAPLSKIHVALNLANLLGSLVKMTVVMLSAFHGPGCVLLVRNLLITVVAQF